MYDLARALVRMRAEEVCLPFSAGTALPAPQPGLENSNSPLLLFRGGQIMIFQIKDRDLDHLREACKDLDHDLDLFNGDLSQRSYLDCDL